jgi:8-oxo-dGTP pyrophosphatase MutT (NUDIX family)
MPKEPVPCVPAATILLVRDSSDGLEVFMVERHHKIDFATGALVFPGGKVDPADNDPTLAAHCQGAEGLEDAARAMRIGAIRETFEEAGVLLARPRGESELVSADRLRRIETAHRDALNAGERTMTELVVKEDLVLATDLLVHFAHWITPSFMPKRFDTDFFLVPAPADHLAVHDGGESVDSVWTTPAAAVAAADSGERTVIFPTLMNVKKLGLSATVAEAIQSAECQPVVTVFPRIEDRDGERWMVLPAEAGYEVSEAPISALMGA